MSIQLAAKGHHMRKIVENGEVEESVTGEKEATKRLAAQKEDVFKKSNFGRIPDVGQKHGFIIHN